MGVHRSTTSCGMSGRTCAQRQKQRGCWACWTTPATASPRARAALRRARVMLALTLRATCTHSPPPASSLPMLAAGCTQLTAPRPCCQRPERTRGRTRNRVYYSGCSTPVHSREAPGGKKFDGFDSTSERQAGCEQPHEMAYRMPWAGTHAASRMTSWTAPAPLDATSWVPCTEHPDSMSRFVGDVRVKPYPSRQPWRSRLARSRWPRCCSRSLRARRVRQGLRARPDSRR